MKLKIAIQPFLDSFGYVNPEKTHKDGKFHCDNPCMFLSEYHMILVANRQNEEQDASNWESKIEACELEPGLLARRPGYMRQDGGPDNILSVLAACKVLDRPAFAKRHLKYGMKHFGMFNQEKPGTIRRHDGSLNIRAFIWRFPQVIAAAIAASNTSSYLMKVLELPLFLYTALVILVTGLRNIDKKDADGRRLCWHLIQATKDYSIMCNLASKVWYWKLYKDFPGGMKEAVSCYYKKQHPFTLWDWDVN